MLDDEITRRTTLQNLSFLWIIQNVYICHFAFPTLDFLIHLQDKIAGT